MGTGNFVLGGALTGLGQGIAKAGEMAAEERRQMALEALRQSNDLARLTTQADLQDRNNARSTARGLGADLARAGTEAEITASRDERQHKYDVEIVGIKGNQDKEMARIRAELDSQNDEKSARISAEIESGQIKQIVTGDDGYYAVRGDGSVEPLGVRPQPKAATTGTSSVLDQARQASGGTAPKPAAQPAPAPAKPQGSTQPARPQAGKTYSVQDAQATAKKHGVSIDEVHRRMREAGYKLTGG